MYFEPVSLDDFNSFKLCPIAKKAYNNLVKSLKPNKMQTIKSTGLLSRKQLNLFHSAAMVYRALNNAYRQNILELIHSNNNRIKVTDIYVHLKVDQPVASQHLAILRHQGIVNASREGKYIYYSINYDRLNEIEELANQTIGG